ncbi:MAG TPA: acetyl-CoA carboxylase biotin carboxylase subunit [Bryobacteraceae bacterium]|nr:acetyl-CoA carboxylase biotin carboxylase subunit [Bryobacteraceae bacterium]
MFRKVLVANRGEIAVRVIRALREMSIASVAVYSAADRGAPHVCMADEAAFIGPAPSSDSYLRIDRILEAAARHGAEAIHPGYGFLSENAEFAAACEAAGFTFIGPSADSIRKMGSKTEARKIAAAAGTPVVPGTSDSVANIGDATLISREIGFPVMIKAAAGGGGKGMRRVDSEQELEAALRGAASEAERAFKTGDVYIEKFIENPRHIEIQLLGDRHGNLIHLGERECSIQRRHQKVIEECPSPLMSVYPELRHKMGQAAIRAARAAGYYNAGTVEFLVDAGGNFYFLEMNTRLQVEHPVTEMVTGLDLVKWQVRIAAGERLTLTQDGIRWSGSSIECRIYAEDPENRFFPSPGRITAMAVPSGPGVRLDSGVYPGWVVPMDYDPLLAKLSVWAGTREEAIARMRRALNEYFIAGIQTNIPLFRGIFDDEMFRRGDLHTGFIDQFLARRTVTSAIDPEFIAVAAVVASVQPTAEHAASNVPPLSQWVSNLRRQLLR